MCGIIKIAAAGLVILSLTGNVAGQLVKPDVERMKREIEEQRQRLVAKVESSTQYRHSKLYKEYKREAAQQQRRWEEWRKPLPFDFDHTPSPIVCLRAYIAAANAATSYDELFKFLPQKELPTRGPALNENVRVGSQSATSESDRYALQRHKRRAKKILEVLSFKIDGNKAVLVVSTNSGGISNGVHYPYGTATIEMLGEGRYWKFKSYNDSILKYMPPPQPK